MTNPTQLHDLETPSAWVRQWATLIRPGADVLDVACGGGRHARFLARMGFDVTGVDRDASLFRDKPANVTLVEADIEAGPWPFGGRRFDGIVVTNYLHRPLLVSIVAAVANDGVLLYETFAVGNEAFGRPTNPAFLLRENELIDAVRGQLVVVAFEQGRIDGERPAIVQRIAAVGQRRHAATLADR